jgi:hypothetical protein
LTGSAFHLHFSLTGEYFAQHGSDLIRIIIQAPHKTRLEEVACGNSLLIPVRKNQDGADIIQQPFNLLYVEEFATGTGDQHDDPRFQERMPEPAGQITYCADNSGFRDRPHYGISYVITDPISCEQEYLHDLRSSMDKCSERSIGNSSIIVNRT